MRRGCFGDTKPLVRVPGALAAISTQALRFHGLRRNLIEAWIRDFSTDGPDIAKAGEAIRLLLASVRDPRLERWRAGDRSAKLFDAKNGPNEFANWLLEGPATVAEILNATGFEDPLRSVSGYMRAVQRELLNGANYQLRGDSGEDVFARLKAFLAADGRLRFQEPNSRGEIARGLLAPWIYGEPSRRRLFAVGFRRFS